jgi:hypothetical protein
MELICGTSILIGYFHKLAIKDVFSGITPTEFRHSLLNGLAQEIVIGNKWCAWKSNKQNKNFWLFLRQPTACWIAKRD